MGYSIRTERYRYTEWYNWETKEFAANELYDHNTDPGENRNIAGVHGNADLVKQLKLRIEAGWRNALPE